jgi:hypothetical protein
MNNLVTAPGALRSNGGEVMTRSTMSLAAHAHENGATSGVRIVMMDMLPGGSEMEVTFDPEQAATFADTLRDVAESMIARQGRAAETRLVTA